MKIKNIILLAGGVSNRFWPLTDKTTFLFLSKSLIIHQVEKLINLAEKIHVVVNESNFDFIAKILSQYKNVGVYKQIKPGQAGAILSVNSIFGETIVVNNNDLFDEDLFSLIISKKELEQVDGYAVAKKIEKYLPMGYFVSEGDVIKEIIEKPGEENMPSHNVNMNVYYFRAIEELVVVINQLNVDSDEWLEKAVSQYIKNGKVLKMLFYENSWYYLKYPWHVLLMKDYFLKNIKTYQGNNVEIDKTALIEGEVYIEDGVKIMNQAKIVGPTYIGKNSIIGSYAMVINSMIGEQTVVGGYSEVTRSYLGKNIMLHRNYIGDSVLADGVSFGAGAVTANYRFDAKSPSSDVKGVKMDSQLSKLGAIIGVGAKIGVNVSLLPGVKIGKKSMIGPGEVVRKDIEDEQFIF